MSEYVIDLPNGGADDERIRLFHGAKMLYGYDLHERIVRCRDCKHEFEEWGYPYCCRNAPHSVVEVDGDGFCKWGELRCES